MANLSQNYEASLYIGSHSVTYRSTWRNAPCLNASQTAWYLICLPMRDGRLWVDLGVGYILRWEDGLFVRRYSSPPSKQ